MKLITNLPTRPPEIRHYGDLSSIISSIKEEIPDLTESEIARVSRMLLDPQYIKLESKKLSCGILFNEPLYSYPYLTPRIDGKKLKQIVKSLPDAEIYINLESEWDEEEYLTNYTLVFSYSQKDDTSNTNLFCKTITRKIINTLLLKRGEDAIKAAEEKKRREISNKSESLKKEVSLKIIKALRAKDFSEDELNEVSLLLDEFKKA